MADSSACLDLIAGVITDTEIDRRKRQLDVLIRATPTTMLLGSFRFYNEANIKFKDDALYTFHVQIAGMSATIPYEAVASSYVKNPTMVHLVGDVESTSVGGPITNLSVRTETLHLAGVASRLPPITNSTNETVDSEDDPDNAFNITITQWTTVLKDTWKTNSHLPVRAFFPTNGRFQAGKKPIPPNGTIISTEGRIVHVRYGDDGFPNLFVVEIDNIARLSSGGSVTVHPSDAIPVTGPSEPTASLALKTAMPNAKLITSPGKRTAPAPSVSNALDNPATHTISADHLSESNDDSTQHTHVESPPSPSPSAPRASKRKRV